MTDILWQPSEDYIANSNMKKFTDWLEKKTKQSFPDYQSLHDYSCAHLEDFWWHFWDYAGVVEDKGEAAIAHPDQMPNAGFFPSAKINFAENILYRTESHIHALDERGNHRTLDHETLLAQVADLANFFIAEGIKPGDRIAAVMPNIPETMIALLASATIGAVFTSCSPDFGTAGVLDRFGQTAPALLLATDGYVYGGKNLDIMPKIKEIADSLPSVKKIILVPFLQKQPDVKQLPSVILWQDIITNNQKKIPPYQRLPFDHPLFIVYSSGTTGKPKCIVHSAGGVLLKFMVEQQLHCNLKPHDRIFFFSTCGWMMWNWLLGCLHTGAGVYLFDGSPLSPHPMALWDYADQYQFTHFGTSAKYIDGLKKNNIAPIEKLPLKKLQMILTTGSPLIPESFDFIYRHIKKDVAVASISGGTDIMGCFLAGVPTLPVRRGELQGAVLGMDVRVFDESGKDVTTGRGELVCVRPFPSMPIYFWQDDKGEKYHQSYFAKYPNIWYHGDYLEKTATGYIIHGRSDATLNPAGVRIGTAEIYRQVEQIPAIMEAIVIGQEWQGDVRVVLFIKLADGVVLDDVLKNLIKTTIRQNCSPRHVPAKIIAVPDIPRTKSGKITELAVRDVVMGRDVKNKEALLNPEALAHFYNIKELQI